MWKPIVKVLPIHTNLKSLIIISRKLIMRLNEVVSQHPIHLIFKVSFHMVSNDFLIMLSIILVNCIYCKHNAITFLFFSHILHLDSISPPSVPTFLFSPPFPFLRPMTPPSPLRKNRSPRDNNKTWHNMLQ